jgi:hypothetical protein
MRPRRAADGYLSTASRNDPGGDIGWAPPVVLDDRVYVPYYGVTNLNVLDQQGERRHGSRTWAHVEVTPDVNRKPNGGWIDCWTAAYR